MIRTRQRIHGLLLAMGACLALMAPLSLGAQEGRASDAIADDPIRLTTRIELSAEYHYRSAEELIETSTVKNGIDLYRNVLSMPPFAQVNWDFGRREGLSLGFGFEVRREFDDAYDDIYFPTSNLIPLGRSGNPVAMENPMITRGILQWRGSLFEVSLGRDKIDLGEGIKGSLYPSTRLPYLDAFKAKAQMGALGMDWIISSIRAAPSWDGHTVDPNEGVDTSVFTSADSLPYGFMDDPNPTMVIEAMHRFTWDFGALRLGIAGHEMYARRNNYFTITDFLPVISWHQTKIYPNNMTLFFDALWRPAPGVAVSAVAGLDEINSDIVGVYDSGSPTVPAAVLACTWEKPVPSGKLEVYGEVGYTHYLWGNFDGSGEAPNDVDPLARAQYYFLMDEGAVLLPLTSPYGPGATWGRLETTWNATGGWSLGLDLLLLSKITSANLVTTSVMDSSDPAAAVDAPRLTFLEVALDGHWLLGPVDAYLKPALCMRDDTVWFEATVGARYSFRKTTALGARKP